MTVVFCSHQISHRTCAFVSDHEIPRLVLLFLILFLFFSLLVSHLPFHFLNLFPSHQISHQTCAFVSDHEIKRCSIIEALADWWALRSGTFPDLLFLPSCAASNILLFLPSCLKHLLRQTQDPRYQLQITCLSHVWQNGARKAPSIKFAALTASTKSKQVRCNFQSIHHYVIWDDPNAKQWVCAVLLNAG